MRTSVTIAAVAFIIFMPMGAFADGPAGGRASW